MFGLRLLIVAGGVAVSTHVARAEAACFPVGILAGAFRGEADAELCCSHGGWPICWLDGGELSWERCCSHRGADRFDPQLIATRRAAHITALEDAAYPPVVVTRSPAGFVERSRRVSARFFARLLESHFGLVAEVGELTLVEVGVQRGRFGHSLLSALGLGSAPGPGRRQARRQRRRHGLPEDLQVAPLTPWAGGPGCLKERVRYVAVDAWKQQGADYNDTANAPSNVQVVNLRATIDLLAPFWSAVQIVQQPSLSAVRLFEPGSLHFVYIDARHDYASVLADLRAWWPLLRRGGVLAGDDLADGEVSEAVRRFAAETGSEASPVGFCDFFILRP
mmetsp:Transcript_98930/g.317216  ORF Transcript_98930/g.317216 Transcript_98930/m.317216 type:complete len:335 (+) Transcript_98930:98-1102(+)